MCWLNLLHLPLCYTASDCQDIMKMYKNEVSRSS